MVKCFYHGSDLDGCCAAAIVHQRYPEAEFIPLEYGFDEGVELKGITQLDTVIMVDYSLQPILRMEVLSERCAKLIWIDHHKSVRKDLTRYNQGATPRIQYNGNVTDGPLAACELAWYYFFYYLADLPEAVRLLGAYDTWRYKGTDEEEDVLNFQYGMRSYPTGPTALIWEGLIPRTFSNRITQIMDRGKIIRQYETLKNADKLKNVTHDIKFAGLKFLAANTQSKGSIQFQSQWDADKYDAMMAYCWQKDHWTVNMYTDKPGIDLGAIAKSWGGGGHAGAAGFQMSGPQGLYTNLANHLRYLSRERSKS